MTYTVTLFGDSLHTHPPQYWLNYALPFQQKQYKDMDEDLLKYNAVFRYEYPMTHDGRRFLDFDTEEDFLLFAVTWS